MSSSFEKIAQFPVAELAYPALASGDGEVCQVSFVVCPESSCLIKVQILLKKIKWRMFPKVYRCPIEAKRFPRVHR